MPPSQQQLERIVAYLDGELSAEESAQVERQLATDEQFRQELQGAQRAWTALDELPMAHVDDEFSRTTMELVVSAARQDVEAKTIALPVQRRKRKTTTLLLATMAVLLGALMFRVLWKNPNRQLLADLPVIQNVDIYSQFHTVQFLQQLHGRLGDDLPLDPAEREQIEAKFVEFQRVSATGKRAAWLESLSPNEQVTLRAKLNRFRDLSAQQQAQLRELHQEIETADQREPLLRTMFRYQQWLGSLPPSEQFKLREQSSSDRVRLVAQQMIQDVNEQKFTLTAEQLQELLAAVQPYIEQIVKEKTTQMSSQKRKKFRSWPEQRRMRELFLTLRTSPKHMEELNKLVTQALPESVSREFQQLRPREKGPVVVNWLRQARAQSMHVQGMSKGHRSDKISEQELADFFVEELEPADKEWLLALPREEMQRRLERMYRGKMSQRDRRGPPAWSGRRPPHPGPPPVNRGRGRHDGRRRLGPSHGGAGLQNGPDRPPRSFEQDRPHHRLPRDLPSREESPPIED